MDPYLLLAVAEGCGPGMVTNLLEADWADTLLEPNWRRTNTETPT